MIHTILRSTSGDLGVRVWGLQGKGVWGLGSLWFRGLGFGACLL